MQPVLTLLRRSPYAPLILLSLVLTGLTFLELAPNWIALRGTFNWQVVSGSLLVTLLCFQWVLFFKRGFSLPNLVSGDYTLHRWVGVAVTYLFALHAVRLGHFWMTGLSWVFFGLALTGVLTRQVLRYRQKWIYNLWIIAHVGLASMMIPLVAVHIWIALAYE